MDDFDEYKIKVFQITDKSLKKLGELLANETSRNIILLLVEEEMYVNQIAERLQLRVSLVIHHLQKLEELKLLDVVEKPISRRTKNHRFFRMSTDIFLGGIGKTEVKEIFKDGIKFSALSLFTFFLASHIL